MSEAKKQVPNVDPHGLETIHIDYYREVLEADELLWVDPAGFLIYGDGYRIAANQKQLDVLIEFLNKKRNQLAR